MGKRELARVGDRIARANKFAHATQRNPSFELCRSTSAGQTGTINENREIGKRDIFAV